MISTHKKDGLDMRESDVMGGGDDFERLVLLFLHLVIVSLSRVNYIFSTKMRLNRGREHRENQKMDRLRELQAKEDQKNASFMLQLGVDLSKGELLHFTFRLLMMRVYIGPIKIQPRDT